MKKIVASMLALLAFSPAATAQDVTPELAGERTQIMVLGSYHLSGNEDVDETTLEPLLDRLEQFAPDIILYEGLPGEQCVQLRIYTPLTDQLVDDYCTDSSPALETLGMTPGEANVALLEALEEPVTDAVDRRRLAMLFLANGDAWSAFMHWSRLAEGERIADDVVTTELAERFTRGLSSRNENASIGGALGNRLGHARLYAMDDHTADSIYIGADERLGEVLQTVWGRAGESDPALRNEADALLTSPDTILAHYRLINSDEFQNMVFALDFGAVAAEEMHDAAGRSYLAWWHTRNLRMAANIMAASGNDPGARVLVITGASHKGTLDQILGQFYEIELVDVGQALAD
ncbi:DUF5694 domain-containing protein [Aurantiacibacter sp. D1-12]|uniref:DUF5694 domain-containing protein n=1 Tax=Aurantiacibacter sp. D1-12 TaxID=2993658 RepID=UPI00237CF9E2|nr:DUF5694 domain-containing protein [Aurantiacibacter sp. D1-12]MDE1466288.1 DUF5694 domain-containing protein [Aurantiacibacter sp. D1-12]